MEADYAQPRRDRRANAAGVLGRASREQPPNLAGLLLLMQRSVGNAAVSAIVQRSLALAPERQLQRDPLRVQPSRIRTSQEIEQQAAPLVEEMVRALDHWKAQAYWGVQNFVNEELEKQIDTLRSQGLSTADFLQSLAGALIWAAACFVPGSAIFTFIVSLQGIAIAAEASPPNQKDPADKGAIAHMAEEVQGYLDAVEREIRGENDSRLLEQAKDLVLFHGEDLSHPELLERFMTSTFARPLLEPGLGGKLIKFNDEAIKKTQKDALKTHLAHFMDVVPLVGTKSEPETVVGRKSGGEYTLSLIAVSGVGGEGPDHIRYGIGYEITPRQTTLEGKVTRLGQVAIAEWVSDDVLHDVLRRESELKLNPIIINAFATEVRFDPVSYRAEQARLREQARQGGLRPG